MVATLLFNVFEGLAMEKGVFVHSGTVKVGMAVMPVAHSTHVL